MELHRAKRRIRQRRSFRDLVHLRGFRCVLDWRHATLLAVVISLRASLLAAGIIDVCPVDDVKSLLFEPSMSDQRYVECRQTFTATVPPTIPIWSLYASAGTLTSCTGDQVLAPDRIQVLDISGQYVALSQPALLLVSAAGQQMAMFDVSLRVERLGRDPPGRYVGTLCLDAMAGPPNSTASQGLPAQPVSAGRAVIPIDIPFLGPEVVLTVEPGELSAATDYLRTGIASHPVPLDFRPSPKRVTLAVSGDVRPWTVVCSAAPLTHTTQPDWQIPASRLYVTCEYLKAGPDEGAGPGYVSLGKPVALTKDQPFFSGGVVLRVLIGPEDRAGKYTGTVTLRAVPVP